MLLVYIALQFKLHTSLLLASYWSTLFEIHNSHVTVSSTTRILESEYLLPLSRFGWSSKALITFSAGARVAYYITIVVNTFEKIGEH